MKKLLATSVMLCAITSVALATPEMEKAKSEAYAHPSMFGTAAHTTVGTDADYIIGGDIRLTKDDVAMNDKENVFIRSWAETILMKMEKAQKKAHHPVPFSANAPTLRSEVATILAEGLDVETPESYEPYSDVDDSYWAKDWIYKVTEKGIMIGYPSGEFKPNQLITKAEVFATIAQIINIDYNNVTPEYDNQTIQYIPTWAYNATNEVVASNLLNYVPNKKEVIEAEYLTKEQMAFLVGTLRQHLDGLKNNIAIQEKKCKKEILPPVAPKTCVKVSMLDRISAKTSNVGDYFSAETLNEVTYEGVTFPKGSIIRGEVVALQRPGLKKDGLISVQFKSIKSGKTEKCLCKKHVTATVNLKKNPNIVTRILGAPFSIAGRAVGVVGRSAGSIVNVAYNDTEQIGGQISDSVVETLYFHGGRGVSSIGNAVVTVCKGVVDIVKITASGIFGIVYEIGDEIVYIFAPSSSNSASINPHEELTIKF